MLPRDIHMEAQYTHSDRGVGWVDQLQTDYFGTTCCARLHEASIGIGIESNLPCIQEAKLKPTKIPTRSRSGYLQCNPAPRIYKGSRGTHNTAQTIAQYSII